MNACLLNTVYILRGDGHLACGVQTRSLEDERSYYKEACAQMQKQLAQVELLCRQLQAENQSWKSQWSRANQSPTLPLYATNEVIPERTSYILIQVTSPKLLAE